MNNELLELLVKELIGKGRDHSEDLSDKKIIDFPVGTKLCLDFSLANSDGSRWLGTYWDAGEDWVKMKNCAWVSDTGRLSRFNIGDFDENCEIEIFEKDAISTFPVQKGTTLRAHEISFDIPTEPV